MDRFIFFATFTYEVGLNRIGSAQVGGVYRCSVPYKKVDEVADMTDAERGHRVGDRGVRVCASALGCLHVRMRRTGSLPAGPRRGGGVRHSVSELRNIGRQTHNYWL